MSAAEKLKALDGAAMYVTNVQTVDTRMYALASLRNALPQIRAVVEAAELEAALAIINDNRETTLGHALAALDEALGDVT